MELASYAERAVALVNSAPAADAGEPLLRDALADVAGLRALLGTNPTWAARATRQDLAKLRSLRARLREVFDAASAGDDRRAVRSLNALLAASVIRPQISGHDGQDWHLHVSEGAPDVATAFGATAVMGLAVLLTQVGVERFGSCAAAPCRNVFIDTSSNRSRRYCSERCATRANVAAYRARHARAAARDTSPSRPARGARPARGGGAPDRAGAPPRRTTGQ